MISRLKEFRFICYQLTRPVSYLRIQHEDKWIYDWLIPILLTGASWLVLGQFSGISHLTGSEGLLAKITDFVENLPGFFIAALAAVATFNRHDIDRVMKNPPKVKIMYQGNAGFVDMTRRRFLCVLFSYLTAASIFLVIGYQIASAIAKGSQIGPEVQWFFVLTYFFIFWQMITATLLGLFYLGERLHTPDA